MYSTVKCSVKPIITSVTNCTNRKPTVICAWIHRVSGPRCAAWPKISPGAAVEKQNGGVDHGTSGWW